MEMNGKTTLGELRAVSEFQGFGEFIDVDTKLTRAQIDAKILGDKGPEACESYIRGFNRMLDIVHQGVRMSYDIYSEEEREADPAKRMTNLLYFPGEPGRPYVVVCPGGAYTAVVSFREGYPPAAELNALGYTAFVLTYRVGMSEEPLLPKPQDDLAQALRFIMARADEFRVPADEYAVMGFSAGGHLAASWGSENLGCRTYGLPEPDALLLGYPAPSPAVFDLNEVGRAYLATMVGPELAPEALDAIDVTRHMDADFPPTYLIHSLDDSVVPVRSSTICAERCQELGVPCKLHLVDGCDHGFGTGIGEARGWITDAMAFFEEQRG